MFILIAISQTIPIFLGIIADVMFADWLVTTDAVILGFLSEIALIVRGLDIENPVPAILDRWGMRIT